MQKRFLSFIVLYKEVKEPGKNNCQATLEIAVPAQPVRAVITSAIDEATNC